MIHRRAASATLLAGAGALLAACGGAGAATTTGAAGTSKPTASTPAATSAGSATTTASSAAPASASAAGAGSVTIQGFAYKPKTITVSRGTRISWVNRDSANHTVTFRGGGRDLGNLDKGQRRSAVFSKRGRFSYYCQYHPFMKGTVVVR